VAFEAPAVTARTAPPLVVDRDVADLHRDSAAAAVQAAAQDHSAADTCAQLHIGEVLLSLPPDEDVLAQGTQAGFVSHVYGEAGHEGGQLVLRLDLRPCREQRAAAD